LDVRVLQPYSLCDVEEWEKENPDNIDKMPIQPNQFNPVWIEAFPEIKGDQSHNDHTSDHMQSM
jgi:hypothetical protein